MAKSSYSLHLIKLKLHVLLDHDVEQRVLFRGYSSPNISRVLFVCVEVLRPSQPNGVMSSAVSLPNHTFTGQA